MVQEATQQTVERGEDPFDFFDDAENIGDNFNIDFTLDDDDDDNLDPYDARPPGPILLCPPDRRQLVYNPMPLPVDPGTPTMSLARRTSDFANNDIADYQWNAADEEDEERAEPSATGLAQMLRTDDASAASDDRKRDDAMTMASAEDDRDALWLEMDDEDVGHDDFVITAEIPGTSESGEDDGMELFFM